MVGIDLVFIPEFRDEMEASHDRILERAFGPSEVNASKIEHLAGLWAAKEAIVKAASEPPTGWREIIISHDEAGKPSAKMGEQAFAISIAHHGDYAVAVAQRLEP